MCFHLKIYVLFFNSIFVFLLEYIDISWMILLLPAIKNRTMTKLVAVASCEIGGKTKIKSSIPANNQKEKK